MILDKQMTKEEMQEYIISELHHCNDDISYFLKTYAIIQHPKRGKIPFKLYPFQEKVLEAFDNNRFNIVLKARQLGLSTLAAGYFVHQMMFNEDFTVICLATNMKTAAALVTKVKVILDSLPAWLKPKVIRKNRLSVELANGSVVEAVSSKSDSARSAAASLMVIDEAAFITDVATTWTAAYPVLSTGGAAIVLSTPNGVGNWFYSMWKASEDGVNDFFSIPLHWSVHPERDQAWRDEQDRQVGVKQAAQENDCDFVTSGNTVIEHNIINEYKKNCKDPIDKVGVNKELWIWEQPDLNNQYIISADNAEPGGDDFSAAHVLNIQTLEQVAEYKGHISLKEFGKMLVSLAKQYNNATLIIENNSIGVATIQSVLDEEYDNLYWTKRGTTDYVDPTDFDSLMNDKDVKPGFSTTSKTRPLMIEKMRQQVSDSDVIINSIRTVNEMWTFIYLNGKPTHVSGGHDDLLISLSIGLWTRDVLVSSLNLQSIVNGQREKWIIQNSNADNQQGVYTHGAHQETEIKMGGDTIQLSELYNRK